MNYSGCAPGFAKDNLLFPDIDKEDQCTLPVIFFLTTLSIYFSFNLFAALLRTWFVFRRRPSSKKRTFQDLVRIVFFLSVSSYLFAITTGVLLLLPLYGNPSHYEMRLTFALCVLSYTIIGVGWVRKMQTLGERMIVKGVVVNNVMDWILQLCHYLTVIGTVLQFLLMAQPWSLIGFQIGIGVGVMIYLPGLFGLFHFYSQCEKSIFEILNSPSQPGEKKENKMNITINTFQKQRLLIVLIEVPSILFSLLWATQTIPSIGYGVIVGLLFLTSTGNAGMTITFFFNIVLGKKFDQNHQNKYANNVMRVQDLNTS